MNCPACLHQLTEIDVHGILVDVCRGGCGGIWFDNFELKKFDEIAEDPGPLLAGIEKSSSPALRPKSSKRKCPKCEDYKLMRHNFSIKKNVEVDECPKCAGTWLDATELQTIREQYGTETHRNMAREENYGKVFAEASKEMRLDRDEKLAKARKFANMFKGLCPSAYIPGKQSWGAF